MDNHPDKYGYKKEFIEKVLPKGETFSSKCSHCKDRYIDYLEARVYSLEYLQARQIRTHAFFARIKNSLKFFK
jgi:hypothetical protein